MAVDPTGEDVRRYVDEDDGGPVVMLNLLRYGGSAGRESYEQYARAVQPHIERVGAEIVYAGDCKTELVGAAGHDWDSVLLVRYPSRQKFLEMVMDPIYQEITKLRSDGLEAAVLQATAPWQA
ncbi:MAG: DUF1330 domain-containing protein [Solirubrobacterales bacterium]